MTVSLETTRFPLPNAIRKIRMNLSNPPRQRGDMTEERYLSLWAEGRTLEGEVAWKQKRGESRYSSGGGGGHYDWRRLRFCPETNWRNGEGGVRRRPFSPTHYYLGRTSQGVSHELPRRSSSKRREWLIGNGRFVRRRPDIRWLLIIYFLGLLLDLFSFHLRLLERGWGGPDMALLCLVFWARYRPGVSLMSDLICRESLGFVVSVWGVLNKQLRLGGGDKY